jgi:hypothetical protein
MGIEADQRMTTQCGLATGQTDEPVTLHRIIQTMIGQELRQRYEAPQKLSHELFVLLMQLNERERKKRPARPRPRSS